MSHEALLRQDVLEHWLKRCFYLGFVKVWTPHCSTSLEEVTLVQCERSGQMQTVSACAGQYSSAELRQTPWLEDRLDVFVIESPGFHGSVAASTPSQRLLRGLPGLQCAHCRHLWEQLEPSCGSCSSHLSLLRPQGLQLPTLV